MIECPECGTHTFTSEETWKSYKKVEFDTENNRIFVDDWHRDSDYLDDNGWFCKNGHRILPGDDISDELYQVHERIRVY